MSTKQLPREITAPYEFMQEHHLAWLAMDTIFEAIADMDTFGTHVLAYWIETADEMYVTFETLPMEMQFDAVEWALGMRDQKH